MEVCPIHNLPWKTVPAGTSKKTGRPYSAFQTCPERGCEARPGEAPVKTTSQASNPEVLKELKLQTAFLSEINETLHAMSINGTFPVKTDNNTKFATPPAKEEEMVKVEDLEL